MSEERIRVDNFRLAAALALVFMLAGSTVDLVVLHGYALHFLAIRLVCALLLGGVLLALQRMPDGLPLIILGHLVALLPLLAILWMMDSTEGGVSTYYAGLNLVLVGASVLLRWRTRDSILNAALCVGGYCAVALRGMSNGPVVFNNFYFLFVTSVFACTGTWYYNRLRLNEYRLRHELENSRRELKAAKLLSAFYEQQAGIPIQKRTLSDQESITPTAPVVQNRSSSGVPQPLVLERFVCFLAPEKRDEIIPAIRDMKQDAKAMLKKDYSRPFIHLAITCRSLNIIATSLIGGAKGSFMRLTAVAILLKKWGIW